SSSCCSTPASGSCPTTSSSTSNVSAGAPGAPRRPALPRRRRAPAPSRSQLDAGTHDDGAVAGEVEVLGGIGRQPGGGDEQSLAPPAEPGRIPLADLDGGKEVGHPFA